MKDESLRKRPPRPGEGRPTKYRPEMVGMVDDYLQKCVDEEYEFHKTRGEKSDSYEQKIRVKLPTLEGFSIFLDVDMDSLTNWGNQYPEFFGALSRIKKIQKERLLEGGLSGTYNPLIAKLVLSANHGMSEKTEIETKHSGTIEFANKSDEDLAKIAGIES